MLDIEKGEKKLKQADSFLTTLTKLLKKHWLILLILLVGFLVYEATYFSSDDELIEEVEDYIEEPYYENELDYEYEQQEQELK
jgi:hypothetical protein